MSTQPQPRNWIIDAPPIGVSDDDELLHAMHEAVAVLSRIGGAIVIAADREQISPDHWQTTRFMFRWASFAPGRRIEPVEVPEPEAEPVADAA